MYSPYFKIRHCFKICFCVKFSSTVVTFSVIHTKQLIATVKMQDTFYSRNVLWWHQRHFTLHFHLTWWDRTQHIKVLTCTKISWITNLIPKVGQWHGERVSLSRYFFLVYELNDAPPNHFWVCSCLVSPFRNTVKFSQPIWVIRYWSSMVTVWTILVNPTIRDSAGTMCPKTSVLNSPFYLCWIIWPHPWESQTRPSFRILAAHSLNQTSPVLAPDAQINAWFFRSVPYEVRPALLQSVNRGVGSISDKIPSILLLPVHSVTSYGQIYPMNYRG